MEKIKKRSKPAAAAANKKSSSKRTEEALNNQLAEWKEKYARLYADFENFRKRNAKERLTFLKTANEGLIVELLPVLDDLERANASLRATKAPDNQEGFLLIEGKFMSLLAKHGLTALNTKKGDALDVDSQEVISQVKAAKSLKGKVAEVVAQGYRLEGKIIRFSKVVVGK